MKMMHLIIEGFCDAEENVDTFPCEGNHRDIFNKNWNVVVRRIKSEYMNEIQTKVEMNCKDEKNRQRVIDDVRFNILTLFMIDYYSDYYQSEFFDRMLKIYLSGHLPCGWSGEYPEGKFFVY